MRIGTGWIARPWTATGRDALAALESCQGGSRHPGVRLALIVVAATLAWFVYVPLHELLHALGCVATGGSVQRLEISPLFGGALWARLFPFVKSGGDYAGRLSGFDTRGSDLTYLCTDFAPYLLTIAGGAGLLRRAAATRSIPALAAGAVLAAAPLLSLTGDCYEMGSILVSRALTLLPGGPDPTAAAGLRHDDLLALLGEFARRFSRNRALWGAAAGVSFIGGVLIAGLTLELSQRCARWTGAGRPRSGDSELVHLPPQR